MSQMRFRTGILVLSAFLAFSLMLGPVAQAETAPLVNNVFDNTYLIDALRDISSQTGVAIIADSTVGGQVTLTLEDIPLEEALTRVLAPGGFVFRDMGGYYLVGAPDTKNPAFAILSRTEAYRPRYTKAEAAARLLAEPLAQYVKVDQESNALVITAPEAVLARIRKDLEVIDRPVSQVMIEAMVVDVTKEGRKNLGLDWGWEYAGQEDPSVPQVGSAIMESLGLDIGYIPAGGLSNFVLKLRATCEKGDARVEANPRVATLDGQVAEIFVGRDRYYNLTSGTDSDYTARLESIKTGITLKLQPKVAENGEITVRIEPEVSDVVGDSNGNGSLPVISRRKVSTTVRVKTGESIVLGGLLQRVDHKVKTKVPLLGDLPILGLLFSATKTVQEEGEVLIIITPYLMDSPGVGLSPRLALPSNKAN